MATEPQDPYADVLPTPDAPAQKRPTLPRPAPLAQPMPSSPYTDRRRWPLLIAVGALLVVGGVAVAFYFLREDTPATTANTSTQNTNVATEQNGNVNTPRQADVVLPADKDSDGLEDSKEVELGTNVNKADTDGDGLGDREEVLVYTTDPKKPDTDGDGNPDGVEVKKGYNPKGSGVLLDLNAAKQNL